MQFDRDVAHASSPCRARRRGPEPAAAPASPSPAARGRSRAAASSSSARRRARRSALFRRLGSRAWSSTSRARPALDASRWPAGKARGAGREASESVARPRPAGGGAVEPAGEQRRLPHRPVPSRRRAGRCRAAARERPGPQPRDRGGGAPQAGAEGGELRRRRRARRTRACLPSPRSGRTARWIGAGPITARTSGRAAMRRCARASRASRRRRRDRAVPGRDDDLEGSLPARADGAIDRFGAAGGPGSSWAAR